jgi:hypothetical protein
MMATRGISKSGQTFVGNPYYFDAKTIADASGHVSSNFKQFRLSKILRSAIQYLTQCAILSKASMESDPTAVLRINHVEATATLIDAGVLDRVIRTADIPYLWPGESGVSYAKDLTDALLIAEMIYPCETSTQVENEDFRKSRAILYYSVLEARRSGSSSLKADSSPLEPNALGVPECDPFGFLD